MPCRILYASYCSSLYWSKSCTFGEGEVWGGGGLGSGEVWGGGGLGRGWFGEVCCLGRYVVWGGLQNAALVLALSLVLASCKN